MLSEGMGSGQGRLPQELWGSPRLSPSLLPRCAGLGAARAAEPEAGPVRGDVRLPGLRGRPEGEGGEAGSAQRAGGVCGQHPGGPHRACLPRHHPHGERRHPARGEGWGRPRNATDLPVGSRGESKRDALLLGPECHIFPPRWPPAHAARASGGPSAPPGPVPPCAFASTPPGGLSVHPLPRHAPSPAPHPCSKSLIAVSGSGAASS